MEKVVGGESDLAGVGSVVIEAAEVAAEALEEMAATAEPVAGVVAVERSRQVGQEASVGATLAEMRVEVARVKAGLEEETVLGKPAVVAAVEVHQAAAAGVAAAVREDLK